MTEGIVMFDGVLRWILCVVIGTLVIRLSIWRRKGPLPYDPLDPWGAAPLSERMAHQMGYRSDSNLHGSCLFLAIGILLVIAGLGGILQWMEIFK